MYTSSYFGGLFGGLFGIVIFIFLAVAGILWFLMPFVVFGIKSRVDELTREASLANRRLAAIENRLVDGSQKQQDQE